MSYERDIVRILRVAHSWLTPCPADGKYCTNCEAAREIETLRAQVEELKALEPWTLYGIWEKSFENSEAGEQARNLWIELTTEDMEGRS